MQSVTGVWEAVQGLSQSFDFGVCLFFFLSSYLITSLLLIEKNTTGAVDVKGFYLRRALRIWPLYFFFLGAMAVIGHYQPWMNIRAPRLLASLLFVANWPIVMHGWAGSPIEPLWSVSVEEQFYLVWPQFARFGRAGIFAVSTVLAIVPFLVLTRASCRPLCENTSFWANSLVQCMFFAGGAITASVVGNRILPRTPLQRFALFSGGAGVWLVASSKCHVVHTVSPNAGSLLLGYFLILLGTLLIFLSFQGWHPRYAPKSLYYLGKITYGLYVFHFLWLQIASYSAAYVLQALGSPRFPLIALQMICALLALAITVCCAAISYWLIETPFLRLKRRFTVIPSRPA
jgi:peptidoglycan/LPS O-acetylase OafA/YrhL